MLHRPLARAARHLALVAAMLAPSALALAQSGELAVRPGQELMEIETDAVDIVFPAEALPVAERLAATFSLVDDADLRTVSPRQPRHLNLVLRTHQGLGNGFVTGTPFHSDWGLTPLPGLLFGAVPWVTTLAVHEYRHVVQYEHFMDSSLMRLARLLTGDYAYLLANLSVPRWAYEGDAVVTETLLTHGGRGRVPSFDIALRARVLSEGYQHYDREVLPSLRRRSGDPYPMGYYLTVYLRREVLPTVIAQAGNNATSNFYNLWSFSRALEVSSGRTLPELWRDTMEDVVPRWEAQRDAVHETPVASLAFSRPGEAPRSYLNDTTPLSYTDPIDLGDHGVYAIRTGYDYTPAVVRVTPHGDEVVARVPMAYAIIAAMSGGGDRLAWLEYRPNWRWSQSGRFVVRVHDVTTGHTWTATPRGTYLHAALDDTGQRLAIVEVDDGFAPHLRVYDLAQEAFIEDYPLDPLGTADSIAWADEALIYVWQTPTGEVGIQRLDRATGETSAIVAPSHELIYEVAYHAPWIYHASSYTGIDAIYAVHEETGARYLVAERSVGARAPSPSPDGETVVFSDYRVAGFDVVRSGANPDAWRPIAGVVPHPLDYYADLQDQDPSIAEALADPPEVATDAHPYRATRDLVHPYGWYGLPDIASRRLQVGLQSANLLNTVLMGASYAYDYEDVGHHGALEVALYGAVPVFSLAGNYDQITARDTLDNAIRRDESEVRAGVSLPFFDQRGAASHAFEVRTSAAYGWVAGDLAIDEAIVAVDDATQTVQAEGVYQLWRSGPARALRPPWSLSLSTGGQYGRIAPRAGGTVFDDTAWHVASAVTVPFGPRHTSLRLSATTYDRGVITSYALPVAYTPGYIASSAPRGQRVIGTVAFPLAYPDARLWSVLYLSRLSGELFAAGAEDRNDAGRLRDTTGAAGGTLFADFQLLRFPSNLRIGVRGGVRDDGVGFVEAAYVLLN